VAPGTGSPSKQRNLGWRAARGNLIAFTDDDCRPEADWLERLVAAAAEAPGAVIQGRTKPDALEREILRAPHVRTLHIEPVNLYKQAANILYPRALIERLDGFDERAVAGEDVGLWLRARRAGAEIAAAPDAVVSHAVESHTLPGIVRQNLKWRYLAYLTKRHPEFRAELPLRVFWDEDHLRTTAAVVGLVGARRSPVLAALALPYIRHSLRRRTTGRAAPLIAAAELPGQFVRQVAEVVGMAAGGVRNRTPIL
jgi:GT2 family glycosyltransferase